MPPVAADSPTPLIDDEASSASAADRALDALTLFARPQTPRGQWWSELEPLLSEQARTDYLGVDPAQVPVTKVTGPPKVVDLDTAMLAIVHIPTDAGLYAVTLSRSDEDPDWRVESLVPPESDPHAGD